MNPQSNYDFIMNPGQAPKQSLFGGKFSGGNPNSRLFVLGGVVALVFIVFLVAMAFKGGGAAANLTGIAETQTEIVRVATEGGASATIAANQNMAINTQLTIGSQLETLQKFLQTDNTKLSQKTLGLKKNTNTDTQLTTAQQNSTYDVVFAQIMQSELGNYLTELKTAYNADKGPKTRALLSTDYSQTVALYQQIPSNAALTGAN